MSFHRVKLLPMRTQVFRAVGEACLPLALEFAWRPSKFSSILWTRLHLRRFVSLLECG
jgi:hypothetical protein